MEDLMINRVQKELINDSALAFKQVGRELRNGICPSCGERELFINLDKPFVMKCRRLNNCNYSISTREYYDYLFKNLAEIYPATDKDPNATATAYLLYNRQFSEQVISGLYAQGWKKKDKNFLATCDFHLWQGQKWSRLINDLDIERNEGKKADFSFGIKYAGKAWCPVPAGQNENGSCENYINNDDVIYITEGIFKSLALISAGKKSISVLSVYNFPRDIFEANKTKKVKWIWAADNDETVQNTLTKHIEKAKVAGIKIEVILPPAGKDWDDCFRAGYFEPKKIEDFFLLSKWRGMDALAKTVQEKALLAYLNGYKTHNVFSFNKKTYSYNIKDKDLQEQEKMQNIESVEEKDKKKMTLKGMRMSDINTASLTILTGVFVEVADIVKISDIEANFLYVECEDDKVDLQYTFKVENQINGSAVCVFPSSALESPINFNSRLLNVFAGADFDGSKVDFKIMKDLWFSNKIKKIRSIDAVGYDKKSNAYIFPEFSFIKGRFVLPNKEKFIDVDKNNSVKSISSVKVAKPAPNKQADWLADYVTAFAENGLVLLSWWIGSLFACQIRDKHEFFPFMEFTGEQGAGKTTIIEFLWKLCGRDHFEGFDPSKASNAGRYRTMQQVSNLPVVFIEGDRNDGSLDMKCKSFDLDELKTAYNGRPIRSLGVSKRGSSTDTPDFNGTVLISQNATISGSEALLSRIIHCHCTRSHYTAETEQAAKRLINLTTKDVCNFLYLILSHEKDFLEKFAIEYKEIIAKKTKEFPKMQNRLVHNHAMCDAILHLLPMFFGREILHKDLLHRVSSHLWNRATDRQRRLVSDHPLVEQFWDQFEYLNKQSCENDGVYEVKEKLNFSNDNATEIAVNLNYFQEIARAKNQELINTKELKKLLPTCIRYKFIESNKVISHRELGSIRCWVFSKKPAK